MRLRPLLSSFAGCVAVTGVMACNALIGNEDITYEQPTTENPRETAPDAHEANKEDAGNDTGTDADDAALDGSFADSAADVTDAGAPDEGT